MNIHPNAQTFDMTGKVKRPLDGVQLNAVMRNVYGWMTMGLGITAFISILLSTTGFIPSQPMFFVVIIAQFVLVIGLSRMMHRLSPTNAGLLFFTYSALTGVTFSIIFLIYPIGSIAAAFLSTAGVFGAMTVVGHDDERRTSANISSYFMMGLDRPVHRHDRQYFPGQRLDRLRHQHLRRAALHRADGVRYPAHCQYGGRSALGARS